MKKVNIFATDSETNGLDAKKHNAISIAIVLARKSIEEIDGVIEVKPELEDLDSYYTLIGWQKIKDFEISSETTEIHGLKIEDLENAPEPMVAYSNCFKFIKEYLKGESVEVLNGFNVTFDLHMIIQDLIELVKWGELKKNEGLFEYDDLINCRKFLDLLYNQNSGENGAQLSHGEVIESEEENMSVIDSIIIDRIFHPIDENAVRIRHSLEDTSRRYGLEFDDNAHDALADTIQTIETFNRQINEAAELGINPLTQDFEARLIKKYYLIEAGFKSPTKSYNGR